MNNIDAPSDCDSPSWVALPDLANAVIHFSRDVQAVLTKASARHELTSVQARLLGTLTGGPKSMGELAHLLGVERAAITGLVDRAQKLGYVERELVPTDRRATHVVLTGLGRRLGSQVHGDVKRTLDARLAALSTVERRSLHSIITQFADASEDHAPLS